MGKKLDKADKIYLQIHKEEFKELGLKGNMTTSEGAAIIREKIGLKPRSRTSNPKSIAGIARKRNYSEEEEEKIKEFMKSLGKEKEE